MQALQEDRAAVSTETVTEPAEQPGSKPQHTDARNDQAAFIQRLRQEAFQVGLTPNRLAGIHTGTVDVIVKGKRVQTSRGTNLLRHARESWQGLQARLYLKADKQQLLTG